MSDQGGWLVTRQELGLGKLAERVKFRVREANLSIEAERTEVTNGHYLVRVDGPRPDSGDYPPVPVPLVPPGARVLIAGLDAVSMAKAIPKNALVPILRYAMVGADRIVTTDLSGWTEKRTAEGTDFPALEKVMPKGTPTASVTLDAEYVKLLMEAAISMSDARKTYVTFDFFDPQGPVRITSDCTDGRMMTSLVMPTRR